MTVKHIQCGPFANHSEQQATDYLKARLQSIAGKADWILMTNYASSSGSQYLSDELDMIVIGPPGVCVVEVKHWAAVDLKRHRQSVAESEAEKLNDKAKRLKGRVAKQSPFDIGFVEGKLLLTKTEGDTFLEGNIRKRVRGIDIFGLTEWKDLLEVYRQPALTNEQVSAISRMLQPQVHDVAHGHLRTFENFFDLERVEGPYDDFHRVFRARRKPSRDKVLLHIYDLSASSEKNPLEVARREFDILQRLQKSRWLPSLMDSFQEAKNYPGELYLFSYVDTEAPTVAVRAEDTEWSLASRIYMAQRCMEALDEIHRQGQGEGEAGPPILHRNLTPQSIHVRSNNEPLLTQLHLAKIPGAQTVAGIGSATSASDAIKEFIAPEVIASGLGASTLASDVYSLCASLRVVFDNAPEAISQPLLVANILELLNSGVVFDPAMRPSLSELSKGISELVSPVEEIVTEVSVAYWDEDYIVKFNNRSYRIITRLDKGGFGTTFKVMEVEPDTGDDLSGPYVAKVITNEIAGAAAAKAYAKVRAQTGVAHLAGVLEVASNWRPNEITALLKWIEGLPLNEWIGALPLYFDELGNGTREEIALDWLRDLCEALAQFHTINLVHGDVSPRNIIVDGAIVTLTDYDTARVAGSTPLAGTPRYCSPDVGSGLSVNPTDDIFALGATIFEVLFDRPPFGASFHKDHGLDWQGLDHSEWPRVKAFLERATNSDKKQRFVSAMDALTFLNSVRSSGPELQRVEGDLTERAEELPVRTENIVPWLSQLLQSYPASPKGNAETRGLDSPFAKQTYVETELDTILTDDINNRSVSLVVLCGNAGDGKTAFLQNLATRLGLEVGTSAQRLWDTQLDDGLKVYANLDGSAAYLGRSANELLDEFFAPFRSAEFPDNLVHLLAINDGPLLAWLDEADETYITEQLRVALSGAPLEEIDKRIRFIDLNMRSLVRGTSPDSPSVAASFIDRLLEKMLGEDQDFWEQCHTCTAQTRCHAWASVAALRDAQRGGILRDRLSRALTAVHQRGEMHITARSLRAALVYIFFGTTECKDLHENPGIVPSRYYDRAFDPNSIYRQGELLTELQWLDPALESHPQIDRYLLSDAFTNAGDYQASLDPPDLRSLRRKAYFEWTVEDICRVGGTEEALALARGRHLETFLKVATGTAEERDAICSQLCQGIARLEDLPDEAFSDSNSVPLKITPRTPTETAFWVNKPRERFSIRTSRIHAVKGVDTLHTHVVLTYRFDTGHCEDLIIGAELFNSLMELREGFQISGAQSDDVFANLSIFKQRLAQEGDRTLFAWNPAGAGVVKIEANLVGEAQRLTVLPMSQ